MTLSKSERARLGEFDSPRAGGLERAPWKHLANDIDVRREENAVCLTVTADDREQTELWISLSAALDAASKLFVLGLGVERAARVERKLRRDFERQHLGALPVEQQSDEDSIF